MLLLALPFQGLALARMLPCAPGAATHDQHATMAMPGQPHDHAAMLKAMAARADTPPDHGGGQHGSLHDAAKSGSCADCCIGAAMVPAALPALALLPPPSLSIPFRPGHVPSVDPVLPERPPSIARA